MLQQYNDISSVLLINNQYDRIDCIDVDKLQTVVAFLKPFKDAANDIESDNSVVSASLVLP